MLFASATCDKASKGHYYIARDYPLAQHKTQSINIIIGCCVYCGASLGMLWGCALWLEWRCWTTMPPTSHIYSATDLFRDSHSSFMIISESDCLALLLCEREVNNTPTHAKNDRAGHPSSHLGINFKFPPWLPYGNCTPPTQHSPEEAPYTRRMIFPGHCTSSQNCLLIDQCQQQLRRSRWNISIWGNRFPTYYWWRDSFSRHPSTHATVSGNR